MYTRIANADTSGTSNTGRFMYVHILHRLLMFSLADMIELLCIVAYVLLRCQTRSSVIYTLLCYSAHTTVLKFVKGRYRVLHCPL